MSNTRLGVSRTMDGVRLRLGSLTLDLARAEAEQLHEEIGRALMPGQPPATDDAPTQAEIDRCGWSEDPYHRCRVCHDYATGQDREHPLTVAAVDPGRADEIAASITAYAETGDGGPPAGEAREHG